MYRVILYRNNGRYVKEWPAKSRYSAKKVKKEKEARYDESYYLTIKPNTSGGT